MLSERELVAMELGRSVNAVPDCDGTLYFANLVDALRDNQSLDEAVSNLECLMTAEIPGVSDEGHAQLVALAESSLRYVMLINDELDAGRFQFRELA